MLGALDPTLGAGQARGSDPPARARHQTVPSSPRHGPRQRHQSAIGTIRSPSQATGLAQPQWTLAQYGGWVIRLTPTIIPMISTCAPARSPATYHSSHHSPTAWL